MTLKSKSALDDIKRELDDLRMQVNGAFTRRLAQEVVGEAYKKLQFSMYESLSNGHVIVEYEE